MILHQPKVASRRAKLIGYCIIERHLADGCDISEQKPNPINTPQLPFTLRTTHTRLMQAKPRHVYNSLQATVLTIKRSIDNRQLSLIALIPFDETQSRIINLADIPLIIRSPAHQQKSTPSWVQGVKMSKAEGIRPYAAQQMLMINGEVTATVLQVHNSILA